jgi:hypothetical protein
MDLTLIGRAIRRNRVLVAIGVLLAVVAGILAGYSVSSSGLEQRTPPVYRGSATIILTNPSLSIYAAQVGGPVGTDPRAVPENANLAQLAMVYAWLVSGDEIRTRTEGIVGSFASDESLTAQRRSTQPTGNEQFGGNSGLPIFDIVTNASSEKRAQEIAAAATDVFLNFVVTQQDQAGIPPNQRVDASILRSSSAELEDGGSGIVSSILVGLVVLFVAFLLIVYRTHVEEIRGGRRNAPPVSEGGSTGSSGGDPAGEVTAGAWGQDESALVRSSSE